MPDLEKAIDYWVSTYLKVLNTGWSKFSQDLAALPIAEKCSIFRGMMVEAGKSGLLPGLNQVLKIVASDDLSASLQPPPATVAPAQGPPKTETPKPAELGQQALIEAPESVPSPNAKPTTKAETLATAKQVNVIRWFCMTPRCKEFVTEILKTKGKSNAEQLSISEASDLIAKLYAMKGYIPPGAKVEAGAQK